MDPIKEAFDKIKQDINFLKQEISQLKQQTNKPTQTPTLPTQTPTQEPQQTNKPTQTPTHNNHIQPLYTQNNDISIRNKGVPTNIPTNNQTYQQTQIPTQNTNFKQINEVLESLDHIKQEIRLKFKHLTPQEMLVFSTIYNLEEQKIEEITYKTIAETLQLSQASIRDYINKLIKKGIPVEKTKQNNKIILLNISQDLKNITTLATIKTLRKL